MSASELAIKVGFFEKQLDRIVADIESEKGTRARVNMEIFDELRSIRKEQAKSDRIIHMAIGGLAVLQVFLSYAVAIWLSNHGQ